MNEHTLESVDRFDYAGGHYWRYFCSCATVGGRKQSEDEAIRAHAAHVVAHTPAYVCPRGCGFTANGPGAGDDKTAKWHADFCPKGLEIIE